MGFFDLFKKKKMVVEPDVKASAAAPVSGQVVAMKDIPDAAFNQGAMGFCCGIEPGSGVVEIKSPVTGTILQVANTYHALGVAGDNGVEIILHVGIDTVDMKGDSFSASVREGQKVKVGDTLLTVDVDKVHAAGHPSLVIAAVLNTDDFASIELTASGSVKQGEQILSFQR